MAGEHSEDAGTIEDTMPWGFSGAAAALDGPYAIGVVYSMSRGCCVFSIGYDGPNMDENIAKVNMIGKWLVDRTEELSQ